MARHSHQAAAMTHAVKRLTANELVFSLIKWRQNTAGQMVLKERLRNSIARMLHKQLSKSCQKWRIVSAHCSLLLVQFFSDLDFAKGMC